MAFIALIVVWLASLVGLFMTVPGTGGFLLMGILAGAITAYIAAGYVCVSMMSDKCGRWYDAIVWDVIAWLVGLGSAAFAIYCLMALLWRGAGISIEVHQ